MQLPWYFTERLAIYRLEKSICSRLFFVCFRWSQVGFLLHPSSTPRPEFLPRGSVLICSAHKSDIEQTGFSDCLLFFTKGHRFIKEQSPTLFRFNLVTIQVVLSITSFFVVSVGGTLIGVVFAILASFITKFTQHVLVMEPVFVFLMSYLAYLTAEVFHFSGKAFVNKV